MSTERLNPGIPEWSRALIANGREDAVRAIADDKQKSLRMITALGLPMHRRNIVEAEGFLVEPDEQLAQFGQSLCFAVIRHKTDRLRPRTQLPNASAADIAAALGKLANPRDYEVTLNEILRHEYGGNIVCNPDDNVYVELVQGDKSHSGLKAGTTTPHLTAWRNIRGIFNYSFPDLELRTATWRAITAIPHDGYGRHMTFHPGYYEFYLARPTADSPMQPYFMDYQGQSAYTSITKQM